MKIEFFPAAEDELIEAAAAYEADMLRLGQEFVSEVERVLAVSPNCPPSERSSTRYIGVFPCDVFLTHSYSAAMGRSSALSLSLIVDGARDTGRLAFMIDSRLRATSADPPAEALL